MDTLEPGDVIPARVTHLEKFGAFIDVGAGLNALIPIDMLSVSRIDHPRARLREGQELRVVLRSREPDKLTFSLKSCWAPGSRMQRASPPVRRCPAWCAA